MKAPNILIVMTDHQRADTLLPENRAVTPKLDKFASEGVTFTQTYSPTAHCCPARATFFSGLYPSRHGIWNNVLNSQAINTALNENVKLWSEDLSEAGYRMYFSGKWHVSRNESPEDRGWKELWTSAVSTKKRPNHEKTWKHFKDVFEKQQENTPRSDGEIIMPGYSNQTLYGTLERTPEDHDEKATDEAVKVLSGTPDETRDPWCLYVGLLGPHNAYRVPKRFLDLYSPDDIRLPENFRDTLEDKPYVYKRMRNKVFDQLSESEVREAIRHYMAYCSYLDYCFGRILDALEKTGEADNTIVLYTSDHGDYCGEHGLFTKGVPAFRGAYHVPAVMRWPEGIKNPGREIDEFVSLADFAPTFLEAAACDTDRYFTGSSLIPFLKDEKNISWRDAVFTQFNGTELYYSQRSVITGEFRYTYNGFDRDELYDLKNDPHEMKNLADIPQYDEIKRKMCWKMWKFAREENDGMTGGYVTVALCPWGPAEAYSDEND